MLTHSQLVQSVPHLPTNVVRIEMILCMSIGYDSERLFTFEDQLHQESDVWSSNVAIPTVIELTQADASAINDREVWNH